MQVSDHETGFGFGILPGVVVLVIAGIVLLVNELVPRRRAASRDAEIDIRSEPVPAVRSEPEPGAGVGQPEPEPVPAVGSEPEPEPVPAVRRDDVAAADSDRAELDDDGRETTRFSRFYRALEPSAPPLEIDVTSPVDLVEEEIREVNGDLEQQADRRTTSGRGRGERDQVLEVAARRSRRRRRCR